MKTYQVTIPMRCEQTVLVDAKSKKEALRIYNDEAYGASHIEILREFKATEAIIVCDV